MDKVKVYLSILFVIFGFIALFLTFKKQMTIIDLQDQKIRSLEKIIKLLGGKFSE